MSTSLPFDIAHLIVVFLGWVFLLSAVALLADRFFERVQGPVFRGLAFAGYGITWFTTDGNDVIQRALQRDGVRLFCLGKLAWFWQAPMAPGRSALWKAP
jgi:hypothetical protein